MKINHTTSVLFWLFKAKQSSDNKAPIYCRITYDYKRSEFSTGKKIHPDLWDPRAGQAKGKSDEAIFINKELNNIRSGIQNTFDQLIATESVLTAENIRNTYLGIGKNFITLLNLFEEYNKMLKERAEAKEPDICMKTWYRFDLTRQKVAAFLQHKYKLADRPLKDTHPVFGDDLKHYLTTVENISANTALKYVKNAKQVFQYAVVHGYIQVNPLLSFKCPYKNPKRERLTWKELLDLHEKDMPIARLQEVKDVYVFTCFTGYAYSDIYALTPDDVMHWIDGSKWLIKDRSKTQGKSNVPLMEIPLAIIEKYRHHPYCQQFNRLLPVNTNEKYNAYLKEIAVIAGINKNLTTHTARHTFATTVLLENDCPIESASEMLGHASIRTTQIYAKTTDVKVSNNMKQVREKISSKIQMSKTGS